MSRFKIDKRSLSTEVVDRKHISKESKDGFVQVLERYHLSAKKLALLVWEYITGFIFLNDDGYAVFEDGAVEKCEDQ